MPALASCSALAPSCWILFRPRDCPMTSTPPRTMRASSVSPDAIRAEQLRRLRERLPEVRRNNPFYRDRLHPVESWEDFQRLPLLTKAEIVADQEANPPFGSNLTYTLDRYVRLHQTSGSSGINPLRPLDTAEAWDWCD